MRDSFNVLRCKQMRLRGSDVEANRTVQMLLVPLPICWSLVAEAADVLSDRTGRERDMTHARDSPIAVFNTSEVAIIIVHFDGLKDTNLEYT
jgi:hypothetical protein